MASQTKALRMRPVRVAAPLAALLAIGALAAPGQAAAARGSASPAPAWEAPAPAVPSGAFGEGGFDGEEDRVALRLLSDRTGVRPGERFRVGVLFDLDPGWHIYWRSPGDSGLPTELAWQAAGAEVGPIEWPTPHAFGEADGLITTYGYEDRVLLPSEATVSASASGSVRLDVKARFLVCEITCVPGDVSLTRTLPVLEAGPGGTPADDDAVALFDATRAARPQPLERLGLSAQVVYSQDAIRPGDPFEAVIALGCQGRADCRAPRLADRALGYAFIPDLVEGVEISVTRARPSPLSPTDVLIELRGRAGAAAAPAEQALTGIVALHDPTTDEPLAAEVALPLPRAPAGVEVVAIAMPWPGDETGAGGDDGESPAAAASATHDGTAEAMPRDAAVAGAIPLGRALLLGLLGGLILNLMPCVLPVLAIKVFAMAELAHASRREVLQHGAAYAVGVVGSMWLLAAAVLSLRAGGATIGWGFQFQEPVFVAAICAVLVVFALNLFGAFEIFVPTGGLDGIGASASGPRRSFFEGLLAVVLATPCSAPFLGTAVGFAFAGSAATIVGIFTAIGAGLAAPFVLVTLVPAWARFVPRAGLWMITLRSGLGFAVLATVVWLLWVTGRLVGTDGMAALLAFLVAVAFAAWTFGRLQASGRRAPARTLALAATIAACAALPALPFEAVAPSPGAGESANGTSAWVPEQVRATLDAGRPAFVYFTADWCITCKVNERGALASDRVRSALDELGFGVFKGDWTQRDAAIARELARFGKGGVPMYLVYDPDEPERPAVLPELLTPASLEAALRAAAPGA